MTIRLQVVAILSLLAACNTPCGRFPFSAPCPANTGVDPRCPAAFEQGDRCTIEDLFCPYPGSQCGTTTCTCKNQPGAMTWSCKIEFCSCTCPCGILATASCDALDCSEPQDECPAKALQFCDQHCGDGGAPDAGGDGGADAGADGGADAGADGGADGGDTGAADAASDATGSDGPRDGGSDS